MRTSRQKFSILAVIVGIAALVMMLVPVSPTDQPQNAEAQGVPTKTPRPTKTLRPTRTNTPTLTPYPTITPGGGTATPTPTIAPFAGKSCVEVNHYTTMATAPTALPTPDLYDIFLGEHVNVSGINETTYKVQYRISPPSLPGTPIAYGTWISAYGDEEREQTCGSLTKGWLWKYHRANISSRYVVEWRVFAINHPGTGCKSNRTLKSFSLTPAAVSNGTPTSTSEPVANFISRPVRADGDCTNLESWNLANVLYVPAPQ